MEILGVKKLTDQKWLNLYEATYQHNGHIGHWVYASRRDPGSPRICDAVIIVPILKEPGQEPRLVLIREYRIPIAGYNLGFPAGLLEPDESIEDTTRREIVEETGLEVTAIKRITPPLLSTAGMSDETVVMVFVDVRPSPGAVPTLEHSEEIEPLFLTYNEACKLCDAGDVSVDAKAWCVLYMYRQMGRFD